LYRYIWLQTVRLHQLPKYSTHILKTFTVFCILRITWLFLILKIMSNLSPKRMKWHFRDSRYKISREGCPWTPYEVSRYRRSSALFKILSRPLVSPSGAPASTSNRKFSPSNSLFSKRIRHHVEHTPFFENTVMFRRDV
jgi:hypothetical protein